MIFSLLSFFYMRCCCCRCCVFSVFSSLFFSFSMSLPLPVFRPFSIYLDWIQPCKIDGCVLYTYIDIFFRWTAMGSTKRGKKASNSRNTKSVLRLVRVVWAVVVDWDWRMFRFVRWLFCVLIFFFASSPETWFPQTFATLNVVYRLNVSLDIIYFWRLFSHLFFFQELSRELCVHGSTAARHCHKSMISPSKFHYDVSRCASLCVVCGARNRHPTAAANSQFLCRDMDGKNGAKKLIWSWKKKKSFTSARRSAQTTTAQRPWLRFMGRKIKKTVKEEGEKPSHFQNEKTYSTFPSKHTKLSVNSSAIK